MSDKNELDRGMSREQYEHCDEVGKVPDDLVAKGWHFCCELDYALVNYHDVSGFCPCYEGSIEAWRLRTGKLEGSPVELTIHFDPDG